MIIFVAFSTTRKSYYIEVESLDEHEDQLGGVGYF